ncbi:MAG: hypothetical protein ACLT98_01555 [Eggerthellaceae bacterium]
MCTLGLLNEAQRLDTIDPQESKRYMHQYNFPPYCTGEVGRMGAPKRRESVTAPWPNERFADSAFRGRIPYAIRVVSEILESNGIVFHGFHMRSTLALMDAGAHQGPSRHRHGLDQRGRRRRHSLRHPGPRGLPRRHGLQSVRHRQRHHGASDG